MSTWCPGNTIRISSTQKYHFVDITHEVEALHCALHSWSSMQETCRVVARIFKPIGHLSMKNDWPFAQGPQRTFACHAQSYYHVS
eukprot:375077-Karenia_brevis.AAC.1